MPSPNEIRKLIQDTLRENDNLLPRAGQQGAIQNLEIVIDITVKIFLGSSEQDIIQELSFCYNSHTTREYFFKAQQMISYLNRVSPAQFKAVNITPTRKSLPNKTKPLPPPSQEEIDATTTSPDNEDDE